MKPMIKIIAVEIILILLLQTYVVAQSADVDKYKDMDPAQMAALSPAEINGNIATIAAAGKLSAIDARKLDDRNLGIYANQLSTDQIHSFTGADLEKLAPLLTSPEKIRALDGGTQLTALLPDKLSTAQKAYLDATQLTGAIDGWRAEMIRKGVFEPSPLSKLGDLSVYDQTELAKALNEAYKVQQCDAPTASEGVLA